MATNIEVIENREKGAIDISIGTSLAIQAMIGLDEEGETKTNNGKPIPLPINNYTALLINLRTLIRNLYGAIPTDSKDNLIAEDIAHVISIELMMIKSILDQYTMGKVKLLTYVCTYASLTRLFPHALFKEVSTEKQKYYASIENNAISLLKEKLQDESPDMFTLYDTRMSGLKEKTLMISHYPFDLLWYDKYSSLDLLESHTGEIKKKQRWYTKLNNGNKYDRIPFDQMTIQLFGDSGGLLRPYPSKYKKAVLEIAEKNKWTSLTTPSRVKLTVKLARISDLEIIVNRLYA